MTTSVSPLRIAEGSIARAQKNQVIDYHHLNSCFTLTAQLSDGAKVGAHFAHFGTEAGGRSPKDLLCMFSKVIGSAVQQSNPPVNVKLIGFLSLWYPSKLGISQSKENCLSEIRSQEALAEFLHVPLDKIQVKDTSFKSHVYLSIAADGSPIIKEKDDDKENRS